MKESSWQLQAALSNTSRRRLQGLPTRYSTQKLRRLLGAKEGVAMREKNPDTSTNIVNDSVYVYQKFYRYISFTISVSAMSSGIARGAVGRAGA